MSQDLRELFKKEREAIQPKMDNGHEERFLKRLEEELPQKKKRTFFFLKIAASILVLLTTGYFGYNVFFSEDQIKETIVDTKNVVEEQKEISLGDLSPDLKKVENYYVTNISLELSKLEVSDHTRAMVDSFMSQLESLDLEYQTLNDELNQIGPNDQTIAALIQNLQLRLELLQKLKKKLNRLNTSKNEQIETNTI